MSTVILDTHVLLWRALAPKKLTKAATRAIESAEKRLVADITLREIAMLAADGDLDVDGSVSDWMDDLLSEQNVSVVAIDSRIAERSTSIAQNFHGDPADQLIAATAIELNVPVITADERLRKSPAVRTIW